MRHVVTLTHRKILSTGRMPLGLATLLAVVVLAAGAGCLRDGEGDAAAPPPAPEQPSAAAAATPPAAAGAHGMFLSPRDGERVRGHVRWEAAADPGLRAVDFFVDGAARWREEEPPYVFNGDGGTWDTTAVANGRHVLRLVATRENGTTQRAEITVTVANPPPDTTPPDAPAPVEVKRAEATSLSLAWSSGGNSGDVAGYRVYANGRLVRTTSDTRVTLSWLTCDTRYALAVVALDRDGNRSDEATRPARTGPCEAEATRPLYVDAESKGGPCDDGRDEGDVSVAAPWCSLSRGVAAAPAGSTVLVREGSYPKLEVRDDHERSATVTLKPYRSETVRLAGAYLSDSSHLRLEAFRITGGVTLSDGTRDVAVVGNDLSRRGVQMKTVERILVERNRIHDLAPRDARGNCSCGVWALSTDERGVRDVTVRGNRIARTSDDGIQVSHGYGIVIEGNTVTGALSIDDGSHVDSVHVLGGDGFVLRDNRFQGNQHGLMFTDYAAYNVAIENNVVAGIETGFALNAGDIPGAWIVNNTFWGSRYGVIVRDDERDAPKPEGIVFVNNVVDHQRSRRTPFARHDYNVVAGGSTYGAHDVAGSPRFVDPAAGDFRLARGSLGIDAGTSEAAPLFDRAGRPRRDDPAVDTGGGHHDVGADER